MAVFSVATLPGLLVDRLPARAHGLLWCVLAAWIAARPLLVATGGCHF
jgi:hypothetical protein